MAFALQNRYGETISIGQSSQSGGTQMVNSANMTGALTLLANNASGSELGRPFQFLNNTSGGAADLVLPVANSCLGQKFYISETGNANAINIQSTAGVTIRSVQNSTVVVMAMNDAANTAAQWYVVSAA